jgi:MFS family permease
LTLGGLLCAPVWGGLTDRFGPRAALQAVLLMGLLSPLLAGMGGLLWRSPLPFFAAFFCLGAVLEGGWAVFTNCLLELAPGPEQPAYIGMLSTLNALPALLLPLAAGLLVHSAGVPTLLLFALALLLTGLILARGLPPGPRQGRRPAAGAAAV